MSTKDDGIDRDQLDLDLDEIFGVNKPNETGFDLVPFEDDDELEGTKRVCLHLKKKKVKFQTFEYWFCPVCRKEIKENK
jgi:hypothetical protein